MKNIALLFVGIVLIGVGAICFFTISKGRLEINGTVTSDPATITLVKWLVGGGLAGLGTFFTLLGLIDSVRGSQQAKRNLNILQTGVDAEGTVTFVDKNYSVTMQNKPIYSIVEYTYQDMSGNQHSRRINNINSDIVIRRQIQVGSKVAVKYSAQNPSESVMVL